MDEQLQKFVVQLRLFGEQCYPVFVRETDGRTTLGYIDPANIEHVVTHPHNVLEKYAVILKYDSAAPRTRKIYRIVRKDEGYIRGRVVVIMPSNPDKLVTWEQAQIEPWEQALLEANGLTEYSGSCFYYSVNNVSNQPRGFSDLLQVADWLDADDETLFALADREQMAGYFAWDVTLINVPKEEIQTRAAEIRGRIPRKGQVNVHNDKEVWEMKAPDLKQQGTIATSDSLSDRSWGMLGLPKPWRGIGEDSNKASATAMGEPTRKTLEQKQDVAKTMILEFLAFVRDQAAIAGAWTGKEQDIDVTMPEMTRTDMQEVSTTLGNLGTALTVLMNDLQLITRATAAKATSKVMAEIGVEYDPTEELEAAEKEAKEREEEQGVTGDAADKFLQQQLKMKALAGKNGLPAKATNGIEPEEDE